MKTTGLLLLSLVSTAIAIPNCPSGWTYFQDNCYRWYNGPQRLGWDDAQSFCAKEASKDCTRDCDSNLVSINSPEENEFLLNYWKTSREPAGDYYWIGYKDIDNSGNFVWSDGSSGSYKNWDTNEPNGTGVKPLCAAMWKGHRGIRKDIGQWDDRPCLRKSPFICKFPVSC